MGSFKEGEKRVKGRKGGRSIGEKIQKKWYLTKKDKILKYVYLSNLYKRKHSPKKTGRTDTQSNDNNVNNN